MRLILDDCRGSLLERMQQLVAKEKEPITPFIDKVRQLYRERGVSSVIMVGGAGDYFDVADTVLLMDEYRPREVTGRAREIAERFRELRTSEGGESFGEIAPCRPDPASLDPSRGRKRVKVDVRGVEEIRFGTWDVDLGAVSQLVETAPTRAVAESLLALKQPHPEGASLPEALDRLEAALERLRSLRVG